MTSKIKVHRIPLGDGHVRFAVIFDMGDYEKVILIGEEDAAALARALQEAGVDPIFGVLGIDDEVPPL